MSWRTCRIGALASVLAVLAPGAPRADIFVDGAAVCAPCDGTAVAPYPTIQEGIDAAAAGEFVRVAPGTYVENLLIAGKLVHLRGTEGAGQTVLNGGGIGSALVLDDAGESSVAGFRITNGVAVAGGGIDIRGGPGQFGEPTITHNVIVGNQAVESAPGIDGDGGGICVYEAPDAVIVSNLILANSAVKLGGGIALVSSDDAVIAFNTIVGNTATGIATGFGPGVSVVYGNNQTIGNNIIAGNSSGSAWTGALDVYYASPAVGGNLFHQNAPQDFLSTGGSLPPGNPNADPGFVNPGAGDYRLAWTSAAVDSASPVVAAPGADLDRNPRPLDADGDGNVIADTGCYEHLGRVEQLDVTGSGTVTWTAAAGLTPDAYHVYRSHRAGLLGGDAGACQDGRDADLTDLLFVETDLPPSGGMFTFLVDFDRNGARGSLGLDTAGTERFPLLPCP